MAIAVVESDSLFSAMATRPGAARTGAIVAARIARLRRSHRTLSEANGITRILCRVGEIPVEEGDRDRDRDRDEIEIGNGNAADSSERRDLLPRHPLERRRRARGSA